MLYQCQRAARLLFRISSFLSAAFVVARVHGASAGTFQTIYRFPDSANGGGSTAGLSVDTQGRLYGSSFGNGAFGSGAVFRLTPPAMPGAPWTEEVLHSFQGSDGLYVSDPVLLDAAGNVFGTTFFGGLNNFGNVFKLDASNGFSETVLHNFGAYPDAQRPYAGVILGRDGLLYGTAGGGINRAGAVFGVSPSGDAAGYGLAHSFGKGPGNIAGANALVQNEVGTLFGVATSGGAYNQGAAYSLTQDGNGKWQLRDIHDFGMPNANDVTAPDSRLLIGQGNLFPGIFGCDAGGKYGQGAIYRLDPPAGAAGQWTETILYQFGSQPNDPDARENKECTMAQGHTGVLYGLTAGGGARCGGYHCGGALFSLTPPNGHGSGWTETVLHSFGGFYGGLHPLGAPLFLKGRLYGTTNAGFFHSPAANGTVWEYIP